MSGKKLTIIFWTITVMMSAFMVMASLPDVLMLPEAVTLFKELGYPPYLLPFLGVAKILAVIAILVPGFPRLKEWAYAGLVFDLIGAFYSGVASGGSISTRIGPLIALVLVIGSYFFYHKRLKRISGPLRK